MVVQTVLVYLLSMAIIMITINYLTVNNLEKDKNILSWEFVIPSGTVLSNYSVDIYRSESPGLAGELTGYDIIASGLSLENYSYTDTSVSGLGDPNRIWYYKLNVFATHTNSSTSYPEFPGFAQVTRSDYAAREILRQKNMSLMRYSARTFFLLKRRTWGTHCTRSWDATLFRDKDPFCPACFGTGWEGGYFAPIPFPGMINPSPKFSEINMFGEWKPSDNLITMLNYPPLQPRDIIVDDQGRRWAVIQIRTVEKLGRVIEQSAQLGLIDYGDILYSIPVDHTKTYEDYYSYYRYTIPINGVLPTEDEEVPEVVYANNKNLEATSTSSSLVELLDENGARVIIPENTMWAFQVRAAASAVSGEYLVAEMSGGIRRTDSGIALVGSQAVSIFERSSDDIDMFITADIVNNSLLIEFQGIDGVTFRVKAIVEYTEISL